MTIADQVRGLIAQHLGIDPDTVTDEALFRDDLGADSLEAFELLMAFEETFGIEIPDNEADPMQRVSDAVAYIETQVAAGPPTSAERSREAPSAGERTLLRARTDHDEGAEATDAPRDRRMCTRGQRDDGI